jgi:hypothetical protein
MLSLLALLAASVPPLSAAAGAAEAAATPALEAPEVHDFLQLQYLSVIRNEQPSPAETGFLLRRARLGVEGTVYSPMFAYRAQLELSLGVLTPLDLYGEFRPSPRWSIRFGQMRVPYSRNWMISEERLAFAERSVATQEFTYDYDIGVLGAGTFFDDRLLAMFGVFNGAGRNAPNNDNVDPLFVARVMGTIGGHAAVFEESDLSLTRPPSLTIGAAATLDYVPEPAAYGFSSGAPIPAVPITARDTNNNGRPDGVRVYQFEGDLSFRWRGLAVDGEAYLRHEYWAQIGSGQPAASEFEPRQRFGGAFAQATYFTPVAHLEAGGRVAVAELSPLTLDGRARPVTSCTGIDGLPFACTLPLTEQRSELTLLAVGHWFRHGVQVTGMYSALRWHTTRSDLLPWSREQRFLLQMQLAR